MEAPMDLERQCSAREFVDRIHILSPGHYKGNIRAEIDDLTARNDEETTIACIRIHCNTQSSPGRNNNLEGESDKTMSAGIASIEDQGSQIILEVH